MIVSIKMSTFAPSIRSKSGVALPAIALSEAWVVGSQNVFFIDIKIEAYI